MPAKRGAERQMQSQIEPGGDQQDGEIRHGRDAQHGVGPGGDACGEPEDDARCPSPWG